MRRVRFDDPEDPALLYAHQNGGLRDRQHRFSAFGTRSLRDRRRLVNDDSPFGDDQLFKLPLYLHTLRKSCVDDDDEFMLLG